MWKQRFFSYTRAQHKGPQGPEANELFDPEFKLDGNPRLQSKSSEQVQKEELQRPFKTFTAFSRFLRSEAFKVKQGVKTDDVK